jgi:hypothetical protein
MHPVHHNNRIKKIRMFYTQKLYFKTTNKTIFRKYSPLIHVRSQFIKKKSEGGVHMLTILLYLS